MGLSFFDPGLQDEQEDEDEDFLLSASELLDKKNNSQKRKLPQIKSSSTESNLKALSKTIRGGMTKSSSFSGHSTSQDDFTYLPPEPQDGNVEYKLKLVNPSDTRLDHLVTQMKWRLREGNGEAIYEMGVEDNGVMTGLYAEEMESSLDTLQEMARRLGATVQIVRQREIHEEGLVRIVAEILVRKVPDDQQAIDLRVCVLGSADVGKSTLLGVLTQGELDNGRGRARLNMFRHLHEIQTGRTSSISHEILGFDSVGQSVDYSEHGTSEDICENSTKLITFLDVAGHQKYLRTTISALTGYCPQYVMLVVSATAGVAGMTQEHLGIAVALEVPFFVVVTKVDIVTKEKLNKTMESVEKVLKSAGSTKVPLIVVTKDDCITAAANSLKQNVVPIFCMSSVNGKGIQDIKTFLHLLPPGMGEKEAEKLEQEQPEFQIDELFFVPGVGTVVGGLVTQGIIVENMTLRIGPFEGGEFREVRVGSIRRNRAAFRLVRAGQSAALAVDIPLVQLRKGMVMISNGEGEEAVACQYFQASVCLLFHPTEIFRGFQTTVHIGNIRQTAIISGIHPVKGMKSSDHASVVFKFIKNPEYLKVGAKLLFREGRTKGIGRVTQVFPFESKMVDR